MDIVFKNFPIKYLGLPLTTERPRHADFGELITSLEKTLARWKAKKRGEAATAQLGEFKCSHL